MFIYKGRFNWIRLKDITQTKHDEYDEYDVDVMTRRLRRGLFSGRLSLSDLYKRNRIGRRLINTTRTKRNGVTSNKGDSSLVIFTLLSNSREPAENLFDLHGNISKGKYNRHFLIVIDLINIQHQNRI